MFGLYCDRLMLLSVRYLKNEQDAEEAMLDGFYKFFNSLHSFSWKSEAALYAFLKRITVNECLMRLRRTNTFTIVSEDEAINSSLDETILDRMDTKEILLLITRLPVGYRTVFNLHVMEGYEHREIAALLGIAEGTSKSQLSKARMLLQKNLLQHGYRNEKQRSS